VPIEQVCVVAKQTARPGPLGNRDPNRRVDHPISGEVARFCCPITIAGPTAGPPTAREAARMSGAGHLPEPEVKADPAVAQLVWDGRKMGDMELASAFRGAGPLLRSAQPFDLEVAVGEGAQLQALAVAGAALERLHLAVR
jgi:hypothetical protein